MIMFAPTRSRLCRVRELSSSTAVGLPLFYLVNVCTRRAFDDKAVLKKLNVASPRLQLGLH